MNRQQQRPIWRALRVIGLCLCGAGMSASASAQGLRQHAADFWDELKVVVGEGTVKRLRIEYENDVFYATDSNYTNGVRLTADRRARVRPGGSNWGVQRIGVGGRPPTVGYPWCALRTALRSRGARVQYTLLVQCPAISDT